MYSQQLMLVSLKLYKAFMVESFKQGIFVAFRDFIYDIEDHVSEEIECLIS